MNLCSVGFSFGKVFGFASVCILDTSPASLPFSLSSEKKTGWEWLARSVHWGSWWNGRRGPPSSTRRTCGALTTWTPMLMTAGQVGGGVCWWAHSWGFRRGGLRSVSAYQGWKSSDTKSTVFLGKLEWKHGAGNSLGAVKRSLLVGTQTSSCFLTEPCLLLSLVLFLEGGKRLCIMEKLKQTSVMNPR